MGQAPKEPAAPTSHWLTQVGTPNLPGWPEETQGVTGAGGEEGQGVGWRERELTKQLPPKPALGPGLGISLKDKRAL